MDYCVFYKVSKTDDVTMMECLCLGHLMYRYLNVIAINITSLYQLHAFSVGNSKIQTWRLSCHLSKSVNNR